MKKKTQKQRQRLRRAKTQRRQYGGSRDVIMEHIVALEAAVARMKELPIAEMEGRIAELKAMIPKFCNRYALPYNNIQLDKLAEGSANSGPVTLYKVQKGEKPYYLLRENQLWDRGEYLPNADTNALGYFAGYLTHSGKVNTNADPPEGSSKPGAMGAAAGSAGNK